MTASTPESPLPVREVSRRIGTWIARLGAVWVEGQVTELTRRPGSPTVFLTLRDPVADVSMQATMPAALHAALDPPLESGRRVIVLARADWWLNRGRLALAIAEVRPVGAGLLLARLEQLRRRLAEEGLFDVERKRPLPFLPRMVGLVCGRESEARHDVVENATRRWPAVRIEVREVAVQGHAAAAAVIEAVAALDRHPEVDVIVVARGGGSLEDLLPFSDEALCRAVAATRTPVVSAIGHEQDVPLLDLVADRRASTPTDAGKMVVPDVAEEVARIARLRRSAYRCVETRLAHEERALAALRSRPVLAEPDRAVTERAEALAALRTRTFRAVGHCVEGYARDLAAARAKLVALSPQGTLDRGYAIVRAAGGGVVRDAASVAARDRLRVRLASGELEVDVVSAEPTR